MYIISCFYNADMLKLSLLVNGTFRNLVDCSKLPTLASQILCHAFDLCDWGTWGDNMSCGAPLQGGHDVSCLNWVLYQKTVQSMSKFTANSGEAYLGFLMEWFFSGVCKEESCVECCWEEDATAEVVMKLYTLVQIIVPAKEILPRAWVVQCCGSIFMCDVAHNVRDALDFVLTLVNFTQKTFKKNL